MSELPDYSWKALTFSCGEVTISWHFGQNKTQTSKQKIPNNVMIRLLVLRILTGFLDVLINTLCKEAGQAPAL